MDVSLNVNIKDKRVLNYTLKTDSRARQNRAQPSAQQNLYLVSQQKVTIVS